jgi:hypothetical protein
MSSIGTKLDANQVLKQAYDEVDNRLRVDAQVSATISTITLEDADGDQLDINADGSLNVNVQNETQVEISAADGDNIAISDGVNTLDVNADGTIDVKVVPDGTVNSIYAEVTSVASSTPTIVTSYIAGIAGRLKRIDVAGTNIAMYEVMINSVVEDKKYTYFGNSLNTEFVFGTEGLLLGIGDTVEVQVTHLRPSLGDFNARIHVLEGAS